jgi:putative two-component system response regulator
MEEKYKVLVVDDEVINRELIITIFSIFENIEVDQTDNGSEALGKIFKNQYNVVLLDMFMPGLDGLQVLEIVRTEDRFKQLPILMITGDLEQKNIALKRGATDFLSKPLDIEELKLRVLNYARHDTIYRQLESSNASLQTKIEQKISDLEDALKSAQDAEYEISIRLAKASEFRDTETGMHIKRMSFYSELLAKLIGFSKKDQELILKSAPLHDIGKIGIEDKILLKPGKLTAEEFGIMKQHTIIGGEILADSSQFPVMKNGRIIALEHHEKWDGSGYPYGKKGEEIHPFARVVAIADVFDALSSKRVYKDAMPLNKVLEIMRDGSGRHFDPNYLKFLFDNLEKFLKIKEKYQDHF